MDLFSVASIPWGFLKDPTRILQQKEAFFAKRGFWEKKKEWIDFDTPGAEFASIVRYVDKLAYEDEPNYEFIYKALILLGQHQNLNFDCPFDWAKLVYEQEKLPEKVLLLLKKEILFSSRCKRATQAKRLTIGTTTTRTRRWWALPIPSRRPTPRIKHPSFEIEHHLSCESRGLNPSNDLEQPPPSIEQDAFLGDKLEEKRRRVCIFRNKE